MLAVLLPLLLEALRTPEIRKELITLLGDLWLYIEHRKSADPDALAQSDAAWAKLAAAQTKEDILAAHQAIQAILARPSS